MCILVFQSVSQTSWQLIFKNDNAISQEILHVDYYNHKNPAIVEQPLNFLFISAKIIHHSPVVNKYFRWCVNTYFIQMTNFLLMTFFVSTKQTNKFTFSSNKKKKTKFKQKNILYISPGTSRQNISGTCQQIDFAAMVKNH